MKILAIASLKGGAGKTALAVFLSQLLAEKNRVLAVDLDHNNNLTDYFLRTASEEKIESANVYHVLSGKKEAKKCLYSTACGVDVLPATISLSRIGSELSRDPGALLRFGPVLKSLKYDAVVIDTPPSLSLELSFALYAANVVLSPVSFARWAVQGYLMLRDELALVSKTTGKSASLMAVPVMVSNGQREKLKMAGIDSLSKNAVHKSSAVKNACDRGKSLKEDSKSYKEFESLINEVL